MAFGPGWDNRAQDVIALDPSSEPEPDVAVVRGSPRDYRHAHPSRPALVVEMAESSLRLDRGLKARLHARAGLTDYWIGAPSWIAIRPSANVSPGSRG